MERRPYRGKYGRRPVGLTLLELADMLREVDNDRQLELFNAVLNARKEQYWNEVFFNYYQLLLCAKKDL